ncbi:MAG: efflux transporter, family, subunit [Oscillospiraceae bacterium]|nr:efflux transporter, family, subunit [Oscillospiraceae bacterium]
MNESTTQTEQPAPLPEAVSPPLPPNKKRGRTKRLKKLIPVAVVVLAAAAAAVLLWKFVFTDQTQAVGDPTLDTASISSISTTVEGSGSAKANTSSTITLTAAGTVTDVYVTEGQQVMAGDPLYSISSPTAEDAVTDANAAVKTAQEDVIDAQETLVEDKKALQEQYDALDDIYEDQATALANSKVTAAFTGQLQDVETYQVDDDIAKGTQIATLVDDSKFRLELYFNYAYQGQVYVGQSATVSIPSYMTTLNGSVEEINLVRKISSEGATLFQVVVVFDNPGALASGVTATAVLGGNLYPYDSGTTAYYRTTAVLTKAAGTVDADYLESYKDVTAGDTLLVLKPEDFSDEIADKKEEITDAEQTVADAETAVQTAQDDVTKAQTAADKALEALDDFNPVAPISGTVISCSLVAGEDVESGRVAISIADTTTMTVTLDVDERNISYIKTGMSIDLTDWNGNSFFGTADTVSLEGTSENNVTTFPVTVLVDNSDGTLLTGTTLYYSFVASQSEDCVVLPISDVRYITTDDGETVSVVFVQKESRPETAIDLPEDSSIQYPDGFYAVPVTIGLSDDYNVEIKEGIEEGDVVFNSYSSSETDDSSGSVIYG